MKYLIAVGLILSGCCLRGRTGPAGLTGTPGTDGGSCAIEQELNGAVVTCEDGTSAVILNGDDGQDAPVGAYSIVDVIKPCPSADHREVILRLGNGQLIAHYSDGSKQFLTFLLPGNYVLTDGSNCHFSVSNDFLVSW